MTHDIALNHQPGTASAGMMPIFTVTSFGVVTNVDIIMEGVLIELFVWTFYRRIAKNSEFLDGPETAMGTINSHDCDQCRLG